MAAGMGRGAVPGSFCRGGEWRGVSLSWRPWGAFQSLSVWGVAKGGQRPRGPATPPHPIVNIVSMEKRTADWKLLNPTKQVSSQRQVA